MNDIILESLRATIVLALFAFLVFSNESVSVSSKSGWRIIIIGFGLLLFASLIDITDNFESLNQYVVIGDTSTQAFLEKVVGYLGGFLLLAIGFWQWLPKISKLNETLIELEKSKLELKKLNDELEDSNTKLEEKVSERTEKLIKSEESHIKTIDELEKINKLMTGRELKMIDLKKENLKLEKEIAKLKKS